MNRFESKEDYLERILVLSEKNEKLRAIDIANSMNYSKPSVSIALKKLKTDELIDVDKNGIINLTNKGKEIAIEIYERHKIISSALMMIGVEPEKAKEEACELEHGISHDTFLKLKAFVERRK
jgi:Mn-dependent DtxR family transcriptional regulator